MKKLLKIFFPILLLSSLLSCEYDDGESEKEVEWVETGTVISPYFVPHPPFAKN